MNGPTIPAGVFPAAEYLREELIERGWTTRDLAARMGGDPAADELAVELLLGVPDLILDPELAAKLEHAMGISAWFWLNIDAMWRSGG